MRVWLSLIVLAQCFVLGVAGAEATGSAPGMDSSVETVAELSPPPDPTLGPWAVDENGNVGRIHTVVPGDTLWDISSAYLGTAWVWPAIWSRLPNGFSSLPVARTRNWRYAPAHIAESL